MTPVSADRNKCRQQIALEVVDRGGWPMRDPFLNGLQTWPSMRMEMGPGGEMNAGMTHLNYSPPPSVKNELPALELLRLLVTRTFPRGR